MTTRHSDDLQQLDEVGQARRRRQVLERDNMLTEILRREAVPLEASTHQMVTIALRLGDAVRRSHFTRKDAIIAELVDLAYQLSQKENTRAVGLAVTAFVEAWVGDKET